MQLLPPSPRSLSPARRHRQAEVTSLCPAAPACGQVPRVHAKGPSGLSGCSEQCPEAPLAVSSFCSKCDGSSQEAPTSRPAPWPSGDRAEWEPAGMLDHPTDMRCEPWEQIPLLRRVRREQEQERRGTGRRSTALVDPARALGKLCSKQPCSGSYPSSPS